MQTRDKGKQPDEEQEKRDQELENIAGNLLVIYLASGYYGYSTGILSRR